MKVLMTADAVGGVWTYAIDLCRALRREGTHVRLATMGPRPSRDQRESAVRLGNVELYESDYRLEWMDDPWRDVDRAGEWLLALAAEYRPDVVHVNGYAHAPLAWSSAVVVVAHSCVVSWWRAVLGEAPPAKFDEYRRRVDAGLAAADAVVAPTAAFLETLRSHYSSCPAGTVIRNGCTAGSFAPGAKDRLVFAAGRAWDPAKNLGALAAAADSLPWPVFIAGDRQPPDREPATELPGSAHLLGQLSSGALADWLARASIYALPARYEPFGLSVLEAARSRCALVLGDIPTLRELWDGAALFVDPNDPAGLRSAIDSLIRSPSGRAEIAQRAEQRAADMTADVMAHGYQALYRELASPRAGVEVVRCAS